MSIKLLISSFLSFADQLIQQLLINHCPNLLVHRKSQHVHVVTARILRRRFSKFFPSPCVTGPPCRATRWSCNSRVRRSLTSGHGCPSDARHCGGAQHGVRPRCPCRLPVRSDATPPTRAEGALALRNTAYDKKRCEPSDGPPYPEAAHQDSQTSTGLQWPRYVRRSDDQHESDCRVWS